MTAKWNVSSPWIKLWNVWDNNANAQLDKIWVFQRRLHEIHEVWSFLDSFMELLLILKEMIFLPTCLAINLPSWNTLWSEFLRTTLEMYCWNFKVILVWKLNLFYGRITFLFLLLSDKVNTCTYQTISWHYLTPLITLLSYKTVGKTSKQKMN